MQRALLILTLLFVAVIAVNSQQKDYAACMRRCTKRTENNACLEICNLITNLKDSTKVDTFVPRFRNSRLRFPFVRSPNSLYSYNNMADSEAFSNSKSSDSSTYCIPVSRTDFIDNLVKKMNQENGDSDKLKVLRNIIAANKQINLNINEIRNVLATFTDKSYDVGKRGAVEVMKNNIANMTCEDIATITKHINPDYMKVETAQYLVPALVSCPNPSIVLEPIKDRNIKYDMFKIVIPKAVIDCNAAYKIASQFLDDFLNTLAHYAIQNMANRIKDDRENCRSVYQLFDMVYDQMKAAEALGIKCRYLPRAC